MEAGGCRRCCGHRWRRKRCGAHRGPWRCGRHRRRVEGPDDVGASRGARVRRYCAFAEGAVAVGLGVVGAEVGAEATRGEVSRRGTVGVQAEGSLRRRKRCRGLELEGTRGRCSDDSLVWTQEGHSVAIRDVRGRRRGRCRGQWSGGGEEGGAGVEEGALDAVTTTVVSWGGGSARSEETAEVKEDGRKRGALRENREKLN